MSNRFNNPAVAAFYVGCGGAIGVGLRYACMLAFSGAALWFINVIGSFLLAFLNEKVANTRMEQFVRLTVMTGMLGSFTTFSSFSYEWLTLVQHSIIEGLFYALAMTACCILAAYAGSVVGRA